MNILYIVDMLTVLGGCEMHIITLATEMAKTNKVTILTNHFNHDFDKMLENIDILVGFNETNYKKLANKKIEVIHSNPFTAVQVGHDLSKRFNARHYVTMHGNNISGLTAEVVADCEKVIFINEVAKTACGSLVPEEKGIIIANPIDTVKYKSKSVKLKKVRNLLNKDFKTIVIPSRVDDGKEIPMFQLMRILPALAERTGGLNVIFVGEGSKVLELRDKAIEIKTALLNIQFTGYVEDVANYLNVADLVLACDRCAIEGILCKKIVFYMGQSKWKQLIQNENFYEMLFTGNGYTDYEDGEILNHLTWMLTQAATVKTHTDKLYDSLVSLCDSNKVKEEIENLYKKK